MVLEDNLVELNKQDIFHQIDREILSQKKNKFSIVQKTRSNYKFVVYLDIIACLIAMIGVIFVYSIFKEQQVRLVSGQSGVKVLETTLLEEINKQYEQDLLKKELEIESLRSELKNIEQNFSNALLAIDKKAQQKFENEKALLEAELMREIEGKNKTEQESLRREYTQNLELIKQNIDNEKMENKKLENEKIEQLRQEQQKQEQLQLQLRDTKEKLEISREKLKKVQVEQPQENKESALLSNAIKQMQQIEKSVSEKFIIVQQNILGRKYTQAETVLESIEKIYEGRMPNMYLETRKNADLYFISLNREFIKKDEDMAILSNRIEVLGQEKPNTISLLQVTEEMREFVIKASNNKTSSKNLQRQINSITKELPDVTDFAYEYVEFVQNENRANIPKNVEEKMQKLLNKTEQLSQEYKVVYMKNPDGFVLDILDKKRVLVTLSSGKRVSKNQQLDVYRVANQDDFKMDKIGYINVLKSGGDVIQTSNANYDVKIGDLIYIKN